MSPVLASEVKLAMDVVVGIVDVFDRFLYNVIVLRSRADSLRSHVILHG